MDADVKGVMLSFLLEHALILTSVSLLSFYLLKPYLDPRRRKLPPGPTGVPLLGYIPFMQGDYGKRLDQLFAKHGKIISMRLGSMDVVFISDFDVIKKIMKIEAYNNRPDFFMMNIVKVPNFVTWNGEEWKEQRKFSLRIMRDIGMGRQSFEDAVLAEVEELLQMIEKEGDKPITVHQFLGSSVSNVLNHMIMGKSLAPDHPTRQMIDETFLPRGEGARPSLFNPFFYMPLLTKAFMCSPLSPVKKFREASFKLRTYMRQRFAEIQQDFDCDNGEVTCFMQAYLKEMRVNQSGKFFDEYHMFGDAWSFFAAGSSTTGDFMTWFFLLMMVEPEIQCKIRQEVDDVIGTKRVSGAYRSSMPFMEAVIHELHRFASTLPVGLPHAVAEDVWLEGFFLPKGTQIMLAVQAVHTNPDYFEHPNKFMPERFISPDGKFVKDEKVLSFGIGKRSCPGEPIANTQLFLYLTSLIQKYEIEVPEGLTYSMDGVMDFLGRMPAASPVQVMLKRRS